MGRSNILHAESNHAKENIIPKVLEYIDNFNGEFTDLVLTEDVQEHFNILN